MSAPRIIVWTSAGAASAVAGKLTLAKHGPERVVFAYCDTGSEHSDNSRFLDDLESWYGAKIERLKSDKYENTWEVWQHRRFLAGIHGAPCTVELKVAPRLEFQRPGDIHVMGYTADKSDQARAQRFRETFAELTVETPLIEQGLDKAACLALLERAGIEPPVTYSLGLPNANCLPCPKATSPAYWALIRQHFPDEFERMATLSRELGARLCRIDDERRFIDEIPADHPTTNAIAPACDFLCAIAEQDMESDYAMES